MLDSTRIAQKHWSYIGPTFWNDNGPILAASRWFTDSQ